MRIKRRPGRTVVRAGERPSLRRTRRVLSCRSVVHPVGRHGGVCPRAEIIDDVEWPIVLLHQDAMVVDGVGIVHVGEIVVEEMAHAAAVRTRGSRQMFRARFRHVGYSMVRRRNHWPREILELVHFQITVDRKLRHVQPIVAVGRPVGEVELPRGALHPVRLVRMGIQRRPVRVVVRSLKRPVGRSPGIIA